MEIENQHFTVNYEMPFPETVSFIKVVLSYFPKSYKVLNETGNSMKVLILEQYKDFPTMSSVDMILHAHNTEGNIVKYEVTNQNSQVTSHTEAERNGYALEIFMKLLDQALRGTLANNIKAASQPKADPAKAIIQLIMLVAAIVAIVLGMKGLLM